MAMFRSEVHASAGYFNLNISAQKDKQLKSMGAYNLPTG